MDWLAAGFMAFFSLSSLYILSKIDSPTYRQLQEKYYSTHFHHPFM